MICGENCMSISNDKEFLFLGGKKNTSIVIITITWEKNRDEKILINAANINPYTCVFERV